MRCTAFLLCPCTLRKFVLVVAYVARIAPPLDTALKRAVKNYTKVGVEKLGWHPIPWIGGTGRGGEQALDSVQGPRVCVTMGLYAG